MNVTPLLRAISTTTTWQNSHRLPLHNSGALRQSTNFSNGPRSCSAILKRVLLKRP